MLQTTAKVFVLSAALVMGGCSFVNDAVWPSLSGVPPQDPETGSTVDPADSSGEPAAQVPLSQSATEDALAGVANAIAPLQVRLALNDEQLERLDTALTAQAGTVANLDPSLSGDPVEAWGTLQMELSRLNNDLERLTRLRAEVAADAASAARQLAVLDQTRTSVAEDADLAARHASLQGDLNRLLAAIGRQDSAVGAAGDRWEAFSTAQSNRLDLLEPPLEEPEVTPPPVVTPTRAPIAPVIAAGPRESGDRFKGRQPLATLKFEDPDLAFEEQLRGLLSRVQAQYPDVAFDIESSGADQDKIDRVIALLTELDIPAETYAAPVGDAIPEIRLYPR
jgi:hypothetical protein